MVTLIYKGILEVLACAALRMPDPLHFGGM
jgi:hypothetical protein